MKIETPLILILVIALVFTSINIVIFDMKTNYPEAGDISSYGNEYNSASDVNSSFLGLQDKLVAIQEAEGGWKIFASLYAIPFVVLFAITSIVESIPFMASIITGVSSSLNIPIEIIAIFISMMVGAIIFALIRFINKSPTDV